ncbi:unnamed protein product [Vitrella brassicaformis CCMP3155]|uniref:Uncharacterized protein n=1 Tax=Vitrella brassicaformis (strain CCMP3155) TaxID=1169540 RepID=A0A0G4EV19_VITBC|nr:unnamed protein product [Vitrella brassicaformis CCMP3155]|eukprot:CEM01887.1 unnamed protein product [Vitrella brassicaformis CCMP3155]
MERTPHSRLNAAKKARVRRSEPKKPRTRRGDGIDELPFSSEYHTPVLCNETVDLLVWDSDGVYVDGTMGGGGHSAAILSRLTAGGRLIGIDQDPAAIEFSSQRLSDDVESGRFLPVQGNFGDLPAILDSDNVRHFLRSHSDAGPPPLISGLLLDLGVSSHQLDDGDRGFSWGREGLLDMRMDRRGAGETEPSDESGLSAWHIVNEWSEGLIEDVIRDFGEDPRAAKIASRIVQHRQQHGPIESTSDLTSVVLRCCSPVPADQKKTLSRVFQGLRIAVNRELRVLEDVLMAAAALMRPRGRLAVLAYHSLEDRRVKRVMRTGALDADDDAAGVAESPWKPLTKAIKASEQEISLNPRARSVRLRVAERRH